ncbi:MAG: nucleotidyltransferase domain-containing protein [Bacteroidia bacterium]
MDSKNITIKISATVKQIEPNAKVLLFGSHARNEAVKGSDYDIMVIVPEDYDGYKRLDIMKIIRKELAKDLIDVDVIADTLSNFNSRKEWPGHIYKTIAREGVRI